MQHLGFFLSWRLDSPTIPLGASIWIILKAFIKMKILAHRSLSACFQERVFRALIPFYVFFKSMPFHVFFQLIFRDDYFL